MRSTSPTETIVRRPLVSVIMAVCNGETYLADAIDSILGQTFTNFEFLIHDDGSTDATSRILHDYAARDSRIVLSSGANVGLAAALNGLADRAQGDYIARMDGDDISLPDRFTKQVAWLDAHPDIDVLGTSTLIIDQDGRRLYHNLPPLEHDEIDAMHLRGLCRLDHPSVMMRAETLRAVGGYNPAFRSSQDIELWLRIAETGRLANLPDVLFHYRYHDKGISGARRDEQMENCRKAVDAAKARRRVDAPFDYQPWRMEDSKASRRDFFHRYAWVALHNGFRESWWHYAWKAAKLEPFSPGAWKPLLVGMVRHG